MGECVVVHGATETAWQRLRACVKGDGGVDHGFECSSHVMLAGRSQDHSTWESVWLPCLPRLALIVIHLPCARIHESVSFYPFVPIRALK